MHRGALLSSGHRHELPRRPGRLGAVTQRTGGVGKTVGRLAEEECGSGHDSEGLEEAELDWTEERQCLHIVWVGKAEDGRKGRETDSAFSQKHCTHAFILLQEAI